MLEWEMDILKMKNLPESPFQDRLKSKLYHVQIYFMFCLHLITYIFCGFSVATGKLATEELEEPVIIDSPELNEVSDSPHYSIDSIKEDEECGPSSFTVCKTM